MGLLAILSKNTHLEDISPVTQNFLCHSYHTYFILSLKSEKRVTENIKDWTFEVYLLTGEPSQFLSPAEWIIENVLFQILSGSWIFCQMERVYIVFRGLTFYPKSVK